MAPLRGHSDQLNDMANQFHEMGVVLSHKNVSRLEDLNGRLKALQALIEDRLHQLQEALRDFGPNSQHLLSGKSPWLAWWLSIVSGTQIFTYFKG